MEEKKEWKIGNQNKCFIYILPLLGDRIEDFSTLYLPTSSFRNCFIGDNTKSEFTDKIFLLYKFSSEKIYSDFTKKLENHKEFVQWYSADKFNDMFVFNVPKGKEKNYIKFKEGKYSEFDEEFKKHILKFHKQPENGNIYGVLYKTENAFLAKEQKMNAHIPDKYLNTLGIKIPRDMEANDKPNMEIEIYQEKYKHKEIIEPNKEFDNE